MELPRGSIKQAPEDFVVEEIPSYEPNGTGTHLYLHVRKRNLTTDDVVRAFARALNVERRDIGVAGLKDKLAVTTQWISLPAIDPSIEERVDALAIDGVQILDRRRHGNKLKTGHLKGNRFTIVVRGVDPSRLGDVACALERIGKEGVPNAFGEQRFGRDGDNAARARAWLTGKERAPGDPRLRRFHFSALQSAIFNTVLEHRVNDATWNTPLLGDLLKKEESGGIFVCTDVQLDRERAARGDVCPTGPMVGDSMKEPEAEAFELEQRIITPLIEGIDLRRARSLGEGTRRALRLLVAELSHSVIDSSFVESGAEPSAPNPTEQGAAISVRFVLPKGAYATTVLANVFSVANTNTNAASEDSKTEEE